MVYSSAAYAEHKTALDENAKRKQTYESEQTAYKDAERKASAIRSTIHERIEQVCEHARRVEMLAHRFVEYLSIANGDDLMAMQFLVKAFDLSDEDIESVRRHELVARGADQ